MKNESESGQNPYFGGYKEQSQDLVTRKRNLLKEHSISPVPFDSNCKTSHRSNDKINVKTLNSMHSIEMAYMIQKGAKLVQDSRYKVSGGGGGASKSQQPGGGRKNTTYDSKFAFGAAQLSNQHT